MKEVLAIRLAGGGDENAHRERGEEAMLSLVRLRRQPLRDLLADLPDVHDGLSGEHGREMSRPSSAGAHPEAAAGRDGAEERAAGLLRLGGETEPGHPPVDGAGEPP